jgi:hypothetical protein
VGLSQGGPQFANLLVSAARLHALAPDAVVVGGTAAAFHAGHRLSDDHDPVVADLEHRFDVVLEALEEDGGWATNRIAPGKVILGTLDGIESGVRQMIRLVPLETATLTLPSGATLTVPTADETLRIKAFLVVRRNQTRDYLDVAALADRTGIVHAAEVLARIDEYYADQHATDDGVASQLSRQLADPRPADSDVTRQLHRYKQLDSRWADWAEVVRTCRSLALAIVEGEP